MFTLILQVISEDLVIIIVVKFNTLEISPSLNSLLVLRETFRCHFAFCLNVFELFSHATWIRNFKSTWERMSKWLKFGSSLQLNFWISSFNRLQQGRKLFRLLDIDFVEHVSGKCLVETEKQLLEKFFGVKYVSTSFPCFLWTATQTQGNHNVLFLFITLFIGVLGFFIFFYVNLMCLFLSHLYERLNER